MTTPQLQIDLALSLWQRTRGDITIHATWHIPTERPCLVLIPRNLPPNSDRITPCIVHIDNAFMWDEVTGDPRAVALQTLEFGQNLGMDVQSPAQMIALTSLIRDHLGDLLMMPPFPRVEQETVAEVMEVDNATGRVTEAKVQGYV